MRRSAIAISAALGLAVLAGNGESRGQTQPPPAAAPPAQAAPPPAGAPATGAAPATEGGEAKKPAPSVTGGYSWSDKPAPQRKRRAVARVKLDPNAPLATYPGFRMASNGTSRVWLRVTRSADVQVRRAAGQVTYVLGGVHVGVRNNTNALVTTHFNTPLARARLVPDRAGALLVLELREAAEPAHKVSTGPHGTMLLEITLPRAQRAYADRYVPTQARASAK